MRFARAVPALLLLLATTLFAGSACRQRQVRIEMTPAESGVERSIATNALDDAGRQQLAEAYGGALQRDSAIGGVRVASTFDGALPSEPGSRNGISSIRSDLGTAWFWYESVTGDPADQFGLERDDWRSLQKRMEAGELWVRLWGRWAGRQLPEGSKRDEFNAWVEADLVPFCNNVMLRFMMGVTAATTNRVDASLRDGDDPGARTEEETFWARIFMPMLLALAEADQEAKANGAKGFFTMDELHLLLLMGFDGHAGGESREWVSKRVIIPAITRQVRRFRPDAPTISTTGLATMGLSFLFFVNSSTASNDLLLASPAISEADKTKLRAGERSVTIPPPYGIGRVSGARPIATELTLNLPAEPFLTNGAWDDATKRLQFETEVGSALGRVELHAPVFFAAWSAPDEARQRQVFGSVILRDWALANYVAWHEMLDERQRTQWAAALKAMADRGDRTPARQFLQRVRGMRSVPAELSSFVDRP